ncbi:MAG TPA: GNAT family N-acetyltransferase [Roseiflexaceae bacterium]|nr:GNAT family N-acetyltransferase [Roseiflexaceae bacterium]
MPKTVSIVPHMPSVELAVRPIRDGDLPFLRELYAASRAAELAPVPWTPEQKRAFLDSQFDAQHAHYQQHYPNAAFDLILVNGEPAGRVYLDRRATDLRVVDIVLLPKFQRKGIGSAFLRAIAAYADSEGMTTSLHVEQFNPALALYARLGFHVVGTNGVYYLMERTSEATNARSV